MTTYTPGKWEAIHDADGDYAIFAGRKIVAITDKDSEEDAANARLIAASPGLLEALKELTDMADSLRDFVAEGALHMVGAREAVQRADSLIKKAAEAIAQAQEGKE